MAAEIRVSALPRLDLILFYPFSLKEGTACPKLSYIVINLVNEYEILGLVESLPLWAVSLVVIFIS